MHNLFLVRSLVVFLTFMIAKASADGGGYLPFIAVDGVNGALSQPIINQLAKSNIEYELLDSPITAEQLKGASVLFISGNFLGNMSKPEEGVLDHRLYTNEEIANIKDYVENGGILIGAGIVWTWSSYGGKPEKDFPLNQIGEALGFSFSGGCAVDRIERKLLSIIPDPNPIITKESTFSNLTFKGAFDKFIRSNNAGYCAGGARRGDGYIYIFGHTNVTDFHPEIVSSVFLGLSPQKQSNNSVADNTIKDSESEKKQDTAPVPKMKPELPVSNVNPLELLAQEAPNLIAWVTSPLATDVPDDFRANISLLREDLLDLHSNEGKSTELYRAATSLCDNLIFCIAKKETQQIEGELKVAQAKARSPLSNQALEARRNYKMSWPQYTREVRQRDVLHEEKADNTEIKASEIELNWIQTAGELRKVLDMKYIAFRALLRKK